MGVIWTHHKKFPSTELYLLLQKNFEPNYNFLNGIDSLKFYFVSLAILLTEAYRSGMVSGGKNVGTRRGES